MNSAVTLAELAVTRPAAARVFYQNRLDFCCGGRRPLDEACRERGLDSSAILQEIEASDEHTAAAPRWDLQPLSKLVDHIVTTYHAQLRSELPVLLAMARKVEERHGGKPECPRGLAAELADVLNGVTDHLEKEERVLFPMIVRGVGSRAAGPVHVLEVEHEHHRAHLIRIRELTDDLNPPASACTTWRALYLGLQNLERQLMEHIHLENNVLFPRALAE